LQQLKNNYNMRPLLIAIFTFLLFFTTWAQQKFYSEKYIHPNDSIALIHLPQMTLPDAYKGPNAKTLPADLNNGDLPYMRPVFAQYGYSCGQASSIGYNFTYEINRLNNTSAALFENQYPPLFTFNFFNNAQDSYGVCYLYTFNAIKYAGTPAVTDYGGMGSDLAYWPTGYDIYYNAMFNRINQVYSIYVGDEEGLQTLKYWLYDHISGTEHGGLANFYTDQYTFTYLPEGTPEEGAAVITSFGSYTGHSMTFVGWNDSIRWDYNGDSLYTNDIDITGDGVVNLLDWEIGGLRIINSHGEGWADSGYCYVMYRILAQEKLAGGIWNKSVNVFDMKENYEPQLTYKIEFKHNSRNKVKFLAGVSTDTSDIWPQYTMDFPIFNFQGGDHFMQGNDTGEEYKTIVTGLDVTPLLSYINVGEPARFFFPQENDPANKATGMVNYFAVMDYINGGQEIPSSQTDVLITENGMTTVSAIHTLTFDKISILNEELPALTTGQTYTQQLETEGGTEPYTWDVLTPYNVNQYVGEYPSIEGTEIITGGYSHEYVTQKIDFSFPFYGKMYDSVTVHLDGFIMFDEISYPLPYQVDEMLIFKYEAMIAPFLNKDIYINNPNGDGLYYEGNEEYAAFRWIVTVDNEEDDYALDFTAILHTDGEINFYIDDFEKPDITKRITGISNGDDLNYEVAEFSQLYLTESPTIVNYIPGTFLADIKIDSSGLLTINAEDANKIFDISVKATDYNSISDSKSYQLSDGIIFDYSIESGNDNQIDYGETVHLNFEIKNIGNQTLSGLNLYFILDDPFVTMLDEGELFGTLDPGATIELMDAISFEVGSNIPDQYILSGFVEIEADSDFWEGKMNMKAFAPKLELGNPIVLDNENGRLDPGETVDIVIPLNNTGGAVAAETNLSLSCNDEYIVFNSSTSLVYGDIPKNEVAFDTVNISVSEDTPMGHLAQLITDITALPSLIVQDSFSLLVGRYPVLIVDLDPQQLSAPVIKSIIEELGVNHDYTTYLPPSFDLYQNLFISLGRIYQQHILTDYEGSVVSEFLNEGGNIFMEGGMTWANDPQTLVHPMFNIESEIVSWNYITPVSGKPGTFTENMWFEFLANTSYYNNYLIPISPAFSILSKADEDHDFTIAYDAETYKTVGSNFDFYGLVDADHPSTKKNLLAKILKFFDLNVVITETSEISLNNEQGLSCFPNPFTSETNISFTLSEDENIELSLYNLYGQQIQEIFDDKLYEKGSHVVTISGENLDAGIYYCILKTKASSSSLKLILVN